ncbi:MAG: sulfite exporter TauE/SafE family protein [Cuniculiplasma sp.]
MLFGSPLGEFLVIILGGIIAGVIGSLTGLGGGSVLVPVLTLFYGVPIDFAIGASLISTIATSAGSASTYTKKGIANIKIGVGLEVATTLGAIVGALTFILVTREDLEWVLYLLFGIVLLTSLIPTIKRGKYEYPEAKMPDFTSRAFQLTGKYNDERAKKTITYTGVRWWLGEIIMFFAGLLSGLLGIGSGALKVLGMDWAMNLPMKVTTTTSNFMIGITAATGSSIYWYAGYISFFLAAATAIGVLAGSRIGSVVLLKISNKEIRWIFFAILSFLGIDMLFKGITIGNIYDIPSLIAFTVAIVVSIVLIVILFLKMKMEVSKDGRDITKTD